MAVRSVLTWVVLSGLLCGPAAAQEAVAPGADYRATAGLLDALIRREIQEKGLPAVSIALVDGTKTVWAKGYGRAKPGPGGAAGAETVYRVGSVSKLFTDLAVMQLVEAGKLDLDAPVSKYLPDFAPKNPFGKPVTLRLLMSHRSGLVRESPVGNYFDPTGPSLADTVKSLNTTELVYEPGTKTKYSNAGIAVVGQVVETVSGRPFAETADAGLIRPLGLTATGFVPSPAMQEKLARGLMWTYDGRTFDAPTFLLGTSSAGNLFSTVTDLGRFLAALFDGGKGPGGPVLKPETLRSMWEPQGSDPKAPRTYGLGFSLGTLDGHKRIGHGGAVYGFATEVAGLPDESLGVAVVISRDCANPVASRIADTALRCLLAKKAGKPLPTVAPSEPVPAERLALAGRYGEGDDAVDLTASAGHLYLTPARGGFRVELRQQGKDLVSDDVLGVGSIVKYTDSTITYEGKALKRVAVAKPAAPPERWLGLIGEYGWDHNTLYILERGGKLHALIEWFFLDPLEEVSPDVYKFPNRGLYIGETLKFTRDANGRATKVVAAEVTFERRKIDGDDGTTFHVAPTRPVAELRPGAMAASPPRETGEFRKPDLVDLTTLDPAIKLDIRYATANNFMGTPFYSSARAFFQRPAADALLKAHRALKEEGYGLLIHDSYRPWHVTKMFWDGTPQSGRGFVANPAKGSKHNRGCAVDLTLYDLTTGKPAEMVGGYDEFSARSSPDYPGGTSLQRWQRDLLRRAMEREGFTVNEVEWWHFDYKDWPKYPILNRTFEQIDAGR